MFSNDNSAFIFIGNVTRSTNTTIPTLPSGAIGIFDEDNAAVTSALSSTPTKAVRVIQKKADGSLLFSPFFTYNDILTKEWTAYAASTQQVSYLGATSATAVTGLGTITVGNAYVFDIELLNGLNNAYTNPYIKTASYMAVNGDTEAKVAKGLMTSALKNLTYGLPTPVVQVDRVTDGTLQEFDNDVTVTKDSQTITIATDTSYGGGSTALVVGDVVNIRGASYLVTAVNSLTVTIDMPYQGASETIAVGSTTNQACRIDPTGITHWGLRFQGKSIVDSFNPITDKYELVRFAIKPKSGNDQIINPITGDQYDWALGFDSSVTEYVATAAKEGTGTYAQVSAKEILYTKQNQLPELRAYPPTIYTKEASSSVTYSITNLRVKKELEAGFATDSKSYISITIAVGSTLTTNDNTVLGTVFTIS